MDTGRPDGASNSPSDSRIAEIRQEGAGGEVARIGLSDGSSFFLPYPMVQTEKLEAGKVLSDEFLRRLLRASEAYAARRKAIDLLAVREQSRARLELKLRKRGHNPDAIRTALDELAASGELDDLRYARLWISGRARRNPCGRVALYAGLLNRGVSRSTTEKALQHWSEEDEAEALRRATERIALKRGTDFEKALKALVRKGFSARAAARSLEAADRED